MAVIVRATDGHEVRADAAVVATNSPINDRFKLHTKQAPYRTYAMAYIPRGSMMPDALYWDPNRITMSDCSQDPVR